MHETCSASCRAGLGYNERKLVFAPQIDMKELEDLW